MTTASLLTQYDRWPRRSKAPRGADAMLAVHPSIAGTSAVQAIMRGV